MGTARLFTALSICILLLAGVAGTTGAQGPAGLAPSTPSQAAWVTVRSPGLASYTPAAADRGNTTGGVNRVVRLGTGRWQVRFPGIGANAVPQVVALNTLPRRCQITGFGRNASAGYAWAKVACFRPDNTPVDTRFVVTTVRGGTSGDAARFLGVAFADQPTAAVPYTPSVRRNSMGSTVTVERTGTGSYTVRLGTPLGDRRSFAVATAVAPSSQRRACQATGWGWDSGAEQEVVDVECQDGTGVAADSAFTLHYAVRGGLEGLLRGPNASFWSNVTTDSSPWAPDSYYDFSSANKPSKVTQLSTGVYRVTLRGMPAGGAVIVNAYGDGRTCQLGSIRTAGTPQQVEVRCFLFDGTTADLKFDFAYTK
jgi:hypothetical protein